LSRVEVSVSTSIEPVYTRNLFASSTNTRFCSGDHASPPLHLPLCDYRSRRTPDRYASEHHARAITDDVMPCAFTATRRKTATRVLPKTYSPVKLILPAIEMTYRQSPVTPPFLHGAYRLVEIATDVRAFAVCSLTLTSHFPNIM
jgi:hypothetical protein